ncbi:MAG: hypothetical protein EA376_03530 [Phycisphaeraceae bacterium]|nr:MAG: hypothetical protein EA376_03530 [Phycisphaeraceae bacterium]
MTRPAFTIIELALATVLGLFVLLACFSLFAMIDRSERALATRFEDVQDMALCHATLRRAMQSLVAAPEGAGGPRTRGRQTDQNGEPDGDENGETGVDNESALESGERGLTFTDDEPRRRGRVQHFSIYPLDPADAEAGVDVGDAPWRLEMVLADHPLTFLQTGHGPIRGAFDFLPVGPDEWILQWTPLIPAGEPYVLAENLSLALVAVLPRDSSEFVGYLDARERREFPRAVRVILWSHGGARTDWLFEPGVTTGETPR